LAVVIEHLLAFTPEVGTRFIGRFTNGFIDVFPGDASSIQIQTQVEAGSGRPDLEICTPYKLVWVEVKAESELRAGQLEGYRVLMNTSRIEERRLVLLTRYPQAFSDEDTRPDFDVRWYELAGWLEDELTALDEVDKVTSFLVRQFHNFLRIRGMTLTQVGKYMPDGLRALGNLLNMLFEAAAACKVKTNKKIGSWDHMGINLDGNKYWVGVLFNEPEKICFGTRSRIDPEAARRLGIGEVYEESWIPGRFRWWYGVELDSEQVHFFSRSKVSQMQWLEEFLRDCLSKARSIETPDQPPLPDDPEEN
jgi:hypothetical protein